MKREDYIGKRYKVLFHGGIYTKHGDIIEITGIGSDGSFQAKNITISAYEFDGVHSLDNKKFWQEITPVIIPIRSRLELISD